MSITFLYSKKDAISKGIPKLRCLGANKHILYMPRRIQKMSQTYLQRSVKPYQGTFVKTNIWIVIQCLWIGLTAHTKKLILSKLTYRFNTIQANSQQVLLF